MEESFYQIQKNLQKIREEIAQTCKKCGRSESEVKLVAVSKFHSAQSVRNAISANQFLFGENRVQEAAEKFAQIGENAELYMIGRLQSNKVKKLLSIPQLSQIESVDRIEILLEIEKECRKRGRKIDVLLEILTAEETKAGFSDEESVRNALLLCESGQIENARIRGFMTMAPNTEDLEKVRQSFRSVRLLKEKMSELFPSLDLAELSMGMSGDFKIAIEEGSTIVRIGTAIFGEREY